MSERAPVQKGPLGPAGTIAWEEHERIWRAYAAKYRNGQTAERIAERGGFGHGEILMLTGGLPQTFTHNGASTEPEADR
jgi:hypothetical protein